MTETASAFFSFLFCLVHTHSHMPPITKMALLSCTLDNREFIQKDSMFRCRHNNSYASVQKLDYAALVASFVSCNPFTCIGLQETQLAANIR